MKTLIAIMPVLLSGSAAAADLSGNTTAGTGTTMHRYLIESKAAPGVLAQMQRSSRKGAGAADAAVGAHWIRSYASADRTLVYTLYEAPSETDARRAASLDKLSVDKLAEVPVDLESGTHARPGDAPVGGHRFLVERTFPAGALDGLDDATRTKVNTTNANHGVQWVTSYANDGKTKTYCIYNGPNEAAIREAAKANGLPVDSITEVPVTVAPGQ